MTENYIQDSLDKLLQNRTTLVIAHRLSTLSRMDRLLVFDKGRIVEEGTHASLLSKEESLCQDVENASRQFLARCANLGDSDAAVLLSPFLENQCHNPIFLGETK